MVYVLNAGSLCSSLQDFSFFETGDSALFRYRRLGSFFVKRDSALFSLLVTRRFFVTGDSVVVFSVTGDSLFFFCYGRLEKMSVIGAQVFLFVFCLKVEEGG